MDKEEVKKLITSLNVWKRADQRAPHKPLLLLYALGRCLRDENRLIPYENVDKELRKLLLEHVVVACDEASVKVLADSFH